MILLVWRLGHARDEIHYANDDDGDDYNDKVLLGGGGATVLVVLEVMLSS